MVETHRALGAPRPCSPSYFVDYPSRRWEEGCVRGRELLYEIKLRGYNGSFSHSRAAPGEVATRRKRKGLDIASSSRANDSADDDYGDPLRRRSRDRVVDLADRRGFAVHQAARVVDAAAGSKGRRSEKRVTGFHGIRQLALRFRHILRSKDIQKFGVWLDDARQSGIYAMERLARTVLRNLDAVTNALTEGWSNGQTEGQIDRLKTLKRAMYGRAGAELLLARVLALHFPMQHGK